MKYLRKSEMSQMQVSRAYPASDLLKYIFYWRRNRNHSGSEKDRLDHLIAESREFENRQEVAKLLVALNVMDFNVTLVEKIILGKYFQVERIASPYNLAINGNRLDWKYDEKLENLKNFDWSSMLAISKNSSIANLKNSESPNDKSSSNISANNYNSEKRSKKASKKQSKLEISIKNGSQQPIRIHEEEKVQNVSNIEEQLKLPSLSKSDNRREERQHEESEEDASFDDYE
jgi:hypothetical protein